MNTSMCVDTAAITALLTLPRGIIIMLTLIPIGVHRDLNVSSKALVRVLCMGVMVKITLDFTRL